MNDGNGTVSSDQPTEETAATKGQRLNTSIGTLTSPSSSSEDSVHAMQLPSLPFEIIVEILSRLPVKLLLQLQSVCKSWKSLISDPKFINKHLTTEVTATSTQLEFPLNNRSRSVQLVDSCNGILCFEIDQRLLLLCNPSIRKFKELPYLDHQIRDSYTRYVFGYTHFSNSYKVVAISSYFEYKGSFKSRVNILTLGTNAWRSIQDFPWFSKGDPGIFVSGAVNWLATASKSSSPVVVSFDLEKESYQDLLQPDYGDLTRVKSLSLGVLRDCLCIVYHMGTCSDVWLMKEYGNKDSWTKLFSLPFKALDVESFLYTNPLYISEDDKVLLEYLSRLLVYHVRDGTFKTPGFQNIRRWTVPKIYQESLISPCF